MELGVGGALFVAATFAVIGATMVWLGGRGRRGEIDFALGLHTRENTDAGTWKRAHEVVGQGVVQSGLGYIAVGVLFVLLVGLLDIPEVVSGVLLLLVLIALSTGWLMRATVRGVAILGAKAPPQ